MSVESDVRESLRAVEDPEMKISVIELGLIYEIRSEDKDDGEPFEDKMKRLTSLLKEQQEKGVKLDQQIAENLKRIGFEF